MSRAIVVLLIGAIAGISQAAQDSENVVTLSSKGPNASAADLYLDMCERIRMQLGPKTAKSTKVVATAEDENNATVTVSGYCTGEPPLTQ